MTNNVNHSANTAFVSGLMGLQRASDSITETSNSIAQQHVSMRSTSDLANSVATQQPGNFRGSLSAGENSLTHDLVSLRVSLTNAQASTRVLDVANDTVGRIINELA